MAYENQCGSCLEYEFGGDNRKGYCAWYKCYYYPDDSCSHYRARSNPSSSCFITTIVCKTLGYDDNCEVLNNLRNFRDNILQKDEKYLPILMEYDIVGPKIAKSIEKDYQESKDKTIWEKLYNKYLVPTSEFVSKKQNNEAISKYTEMVTMLKDYYNYDTQEEIKNVMNYDMSLGGHGKVKTLYK